MELGNSKTVYVVQVDYQKDLSDAKKYGQLRAVFSNPRKPYDTETMVSKARHVLQNWIDGDYLLMIGDPTLCAVCMGVVLEQNGRVNILSWDRNTFQYIPQTWDFDIEPYDFTTAED